MRIINLVENEPSASGCEAAHGLSFYVETENHKLLFDTSPSEVVLSNAQKLGVDLTAVDTVILSHGHYDHSGGIMAFVEINPRAKIYMQHNAAVIIMPSTEKTRASAISELIRKFSR